MNLGRVGSLTVSRANCRRFCRPRSRAFGATAILCLALLALLAFVQVTHVHTVAADIEHCPLCIVVHLAATVTAAPPAVVQVAIKNPAPVLVTRLIVRYRHTSLFTRPPPIGC